MPKAYLCHSSKDKKSYVELVANKFGPNKCIYNDITFEKGMKSIEEIEKGLDKTDIFVIFLSNASLESNWVKEELKRAHDLFGEKIIKRIYPIIIDSKITYKDSRIPVWLQREYNLKYVSRPNVATRKIKQRLREISWDFHPRLKEKEKIFVGRNDLIREFEERIHSLDDPTPICIIASGINKIGRKVFLKHSLRKTNNMDESYDPPLIKLSVDESIEDFIFKIYDLGFSKGLNLKDFMKRTIKEKIKIACKLLEDIQNEKEILFINDTGCIVIPERDINDWFKAILHYFEDSEKITMCVASKFRLLEYKIRDIKNLFNLNVPELDIAERIGLLKQYSIFEGLQLAKKNLRFFSNLLTGYPEQVFYCIELIKDLGLVKTKNNSYLIVEFNKEKVSRLLLEYEENEKAMDFLHLLSRFDFISYDFLLEIVGNEGFYLNLLEEFFATAVCEALGANNEYIRLNDIIRDYISRIKHELPSDYQVKLNEHLTEFLKHYAPEETDASDFFYSMKEALKSGNKIDERYLIPSHFLKTIKELYEDYNNYNDVIKLSDRILQNTKFIDDSIVWQIQYYLCLSLARKGKSRFLSEVQKIHGPDHNFLLGFYYRLKGRNKDALEKIKLALDDRPEFPRAQRELVQLYIFIEDYDSARELARENYVRNKTNHYHIQAYLKCVLHDEKNEENEKIVKELLNNLSISKSDKAREMYLQGLSEYFAFYSNDEHNSIDTITQAINEFPDSVYPYLAKFGICEKFNRLQDMEKTIKQLENTIKDREYLNNSLLICKAIYQAKIGNIDVAENFIGRIRNFPDHAIEILFKKIREIYSYTIH